jgi:hypothetical protein
MIFASELLKEITLTKDLSRERRKGRKKEKKEIEA